MLGKQVTCLFVLNVAIIVNTKTLLLSVCCQSRPPREGELALHTLKPGINISIPATWFHLEKPTLQQQQQLYRHQTDSVAEQHSVLST